MVKCGAHCGLTEDPMLTVLPVSMKGISEDDWSEWLSIPKTQSVSDIIRGNVEKGLPCGSDNFISVLGGDNKKIVTL